MGRVGAGLLAVGLSGIWAGSRGAASWLGFWQPQTRQAAKADAGAGNDQPVADDDDAAPAETVRRAAESDEPAPTLPEGPTRQPAETGPPMKEVPVTTMFRDQAAEMLRVASTYPADRPMSQVKLDLAHLPEALSDIARAMHVYAQRLSPAESPLRQEIADVLTSIGSLYVAAAKQAQDLPGSFGQLHQQELERIETPRPNEAAWDVTRQ